LSGTLAIRNHSKEMKLNYSNVTYFSVLFTPINDPLVSGFSTRVFFQMLEEERSFTGVREITKQTLWALGHRGGTKITKVLDKKVTLTLYM